jgi:Zn-finger protein
MSSTEEFCAKLVREWQHSLGASRTTFGDTQHLGSTKPYIEEVFMGRLSLLVACACTLALLPLCAAGEDRKAQTIDELARMYDVSSCKSCHEKIYEEWEKSLHARSILGTPRTSDAFGRMVKAYLLGGQWKYAGVTKIEDLKTEHVIQCLECHLPQIKDVTDAVARELAQAAMDGDTKTLEKVNINRLPQQESDSPPVG